MGRKKENDTSVENKLRRTKFTMKLTLIKRPSLRIKCAERLFEYLSWSMKTNNKPIITTKMPRKDKSKNMYYTVCQYYTIPVSCFSMSFVNSTTQIVGTQLLQHSGP